MPSGWTKTDRIIESELHKKAKPMKKGTISWLGLVILLVWSCSSALAQDLYVQEVSVTPSSVQAGEVVHSQAVIKNLGPGTAYTAQYGWYISTDPEITNKDIALGQVQTLSQVLYPGNAVTVQADLAMPPFNDDSLPSYIGLRLDPEGLMPDTDPNNDWASAQLQISNPAGVHFDTLGDNELDISSVQSLIQGDSLITDITFASPPGSIYGFMALDLDQEPATGLSSLTVPGAEAFLDLVIHEYFSSLELTTASGTRQVGTFQLQGNTLSYTIPVSWLGQGQVMDVFWALDSSPGTSADLDRVPDLGAYATDTGQAVVRRPGNTSISVSIPDPIAGEQEFPDLSHMEAGVQGDQLRVSLRFDHQVENLSLQPGFEGLFIWIDLDRDLRLATGFKNSGCQPPSFGIDSSIRLQIDPLAGDVFELLTDTDGDGSPEVTPMGLPVNDMFVRLDNDTIDIRMPLIYLGQYDGSGAILVNALNTRDILSGPMEHLPDAGAWDLALNSPLPAQACSSPVDHYADPADDSIGAFGLDNDELVGLELCVGQKALLFTIDYKSYELSNDGATLIYFDIDNNRNTGWEIHNINQQVTIGADYILRTYWYTDEMIQITKLLKCTPPEEVHLSNQLTAVTLADRIYITVPLESLGNPTGEAKLFVQTASWGGGPILLPNDDLPNNGLIRVNLSFCLGDFDNDQDVDGVDLSTFAADFGRTDCTDDCEGDFDGDGDVDGMDLSTFAADFGRTDCP